MEVLMSTKVLFVYGVGNSNGKTLFNESAITVDEAVETAESLGGKVVTEIAGEDVAFEVYQFGEIDMDFIKLLTDEGIMSEASRGLYFIGV
jgi:hypothetical protein